MQSPETPNYFSIYESLKTWDQLYSQKNSVNTHLFKSLESTNDWAKAHILKPNILNFTATDLQTNGRGQYDRKWVSTPEGHGLFCTWSFMIKPKFLDENLSSIVGNNLLNNISLVFPSIQPFISLKLPNDILIRYKKTAGILTEIISVGNHHTVHIGLGLNVWSSPKGLDQPTTHLSQHLTMQTQGQHSELSQKNFFKLMNLTAMQFKRKLI